VSKRKDSPYRSGRSPDWLKAQLGGAQERRQGASRVLGCCQKRLL
jgi:hypothetical protein